MWPGRGGSAWILASAPSSQSLMSPCLQVTFLLSYSILGCRSLTMTWHFWYRHQTVVPSPVLPGCLRCLSHRADSSSLQAWVSGPLGGMAEGVKPMLPSIWVSHSLACWGRVVLCHKALLCVCPFSVLAVLLRQLQPWVLSWSLEARGFLVCSFSRFWPFRVP